MLETRLRVRLSGSEVFEFLANPTDEAYRRWWPGIHVQFHTLEPHAGHVGDVVYMDEYVGSRRLRMQGIVHRGASRPEARLAAQTPGQDPGAPLAQAQ